MGQKYIRPVFAWQSPVTGRRVGMPTARISAGMLNEDVQVREFLKKKLKHASVGRV
jgi:hypothetical protein